MMEKQNKSIAVQWLVPSAILLMVLVIMMFNFSAKSKTNAKDMVTGNMTETAGDCADSFMEELISLEQVAKPIAELLGNKTPLNSAYAAQLTKVAMEYTDAYMVYSCDESGIGVDSNGENISIAERAYFEEIKETAEVEYIYAADDGIKGESAIIVVVPIMREKQNGYMLLFYSLSNFESVIKEDNFAAWSIETLIDGNGNILKTAGTGNQWITGTNLYDEIKGNNPENAKKMRTRIDNRVSGMVSVNMNNVKNVLVYAPIDINDWTLVVGISQSYVDRQISQQWDSTKSMLYQLVIVFLIFVCIIVVINIVSKIHNNEKKRQLEEKADTDLLTGLNNKLATERKIKEFMAQNPDAQSMMFILDIDNFKKINDTMGHAFGDEVLRSLGQQIGAIFRATDVVGRFGGDEFIVFLKNTTSPEAVRKEASKVENFFKDFKAGEYVKYSATASIGVAIFPQEGHDFETLFKAADQALYKAKKRGKNQLAFYKDEWAGEQK